MNREEFKSQNLNLSVPLIQNLFKNYPKFMFEEQNKTNIRLKIEKNLKASKSNPIICEIKT